MYKILIFNKLHKNSRVRTSLEAALIPKKRKSQEIVNF
jgi:hypothetical protein